MLIEVLIAVGAVCAVGVLLGALLGVFSHFFRVEEDQTAKRIRACLPGINCGACGFKGCDDYAASLSEGKTRANLCVPGGEDATEQIGAILGIEIEPPRDVVAFAHCDGNCSATGKKATYRGVDTCRAAAMVYGGPDACRFGCMGFGDCAAACPANAICVRDGIAHVDTSRCLGCGLCVTVCPKGVLQMVPQEASVAVICSSKDKGADARKACSNACIACKKCEKNCPSQAITVVNNLAEIDYTKCTGCGLCADDCPTGCLKKVHLPDRPEEESGSR